MPSSKAAALASNKPLPSAYYDGLGVATRSGREKQNPVFQKLEQEISRYVNYMKSRAQPNYQKPAEESFSRSSDVLFDLWNKYEPLVPTLYYQKKVIEMADFLVTLKEFNLADFQCFSRYLDMFGDVKVDEITDVDLFKSTYFPQGFGAENAGYTFRALMGKSICMFQVVKNGDPKLQNTETVDACIRIMNFLRLVTQVILPKDDLCWLVYNGTVHIYSVCRYLMAYGHTAKVVEYLLWASMCMETSVVLLGKKYLVWRTTLYTAICQCYYDCMASDKAEAFARRALLKINELSQLENLSESKPSSQTEKIFRHATIKMAIMVFKRAAFESRKKPKGFLRPKTRANLKDAHALPWPRTPTEKLLVDMFEGSAAQFLCIIETLTDTNKRTLITQPPAPDSEVETLDVYAELFMAAQEVICGGAGSLPNSGSVTIPNRTTGLIEMPGVCRDQSLMQMAAAGMNGVPLSAVVKLIKLAYCFEHWDVFDTLVDPIKQFIKKNDHPALRSVEREIALLIAMQKLNPSHRRKLELEALEKEKEKEKEREKQERRNQQESSEHSVSVKRKTTVPATAADTSVIALAKTKSADSVDDLMDLAKVLHSFTSTPMVTADNVDLDMVVDATLFLWNKCKAVFQKYQTGSLENWKYIQKMDQAGKWVYMLENVQVVLGWCGLNTVDPGLSAEIALRLSLVLEAAAACKQATAERLNTSDSDKEDFDGSYPPSKGYSRPASKGEFSQAGLSSILDQPIRDLLVTARNILELGLKNVSAARRVVALNDGRSIADISWSKELNQKLFTTDSAPSSEANSEGTSQTASSASTVWNTVKDLHMELFYMYHRVCLKLLTLPPEFKPVSQKTFKRSTCSKSVGGEAPAARNFNFTADYEELLNDCQKNSLVKALLLMQKALSLNNLANSVEQQSLLAEAQELIIRTQEEDKRLYLENSMQVKETVSPKKIPGPPILLSRTDTTMVFKPSPFLPLSGEKVAWYRLFGRDASGSNIRVRLNDYHIQGCGDEIPATSFCLFRVQNIMPHKRYVFAVAAYTAEGKLIGDSIGDISKPVLASHPLPVQMAWAYLAQVAYQVGQYNVATTACQILWEYFVSAIPQPRQETYVTSAQNDFKLTLYRLNKKVLNTGSPVLLRMFLSSIFIAGDIAIREKQLYCDRLCDQGSLYNGQIMRLKECQKLMVALELAGWLNESNMALQAAIQCYGLLAPLLYWKVPSIPVIQILERCHVVLQEIPSSLLTRRTERVNESLHHMTACITYHLAKTLRTWGQRSLASKLNDAGRKLLSIESGTHGSGSSEIPDGFGDDSNNHNEDEGLMSLAALKKRSSKKQAKVSKDKDDEPTGNCQLRALEAHMLKLSRQAQGEHELTGNEDPSVLNAYIAYLPSRLAFKEVQKFKRRNRYLEFLVQVVQKAITEGFSELAIDWCEDAIQWISKRNEMVIGNKAIINKQVGAIAVQGDDPKKFAAAMVEYNRQKELGSAHAGKAQLPKNNARKRNKMKLVAIPAHYTAEQRAAEEERQMAAIERLALFLPDLFKANIRKKKFRRICNEDMPWRAQLNIVLGLSHFGVFLNKLEMKEKLIGNKQILAYSTAFLDPEWFTFETAGTMVVGMDGGSPRVNKTRGTHPSKTVFHLNTPATRGARKSEKDVSKASGIEKAAAAATGAAPPEMFPVPPEKPDSPRTPRTPEPINVEERKGSADNNILSTQITQEYLENTFNYLKRAIVLAHRGEHWNLLQNAVRSLWNCAHTALIRAFTNDPASKTGLLTNNALREVLWFPLTMACDHWLDMMFHIKLQMKAKAARLGEPKFSFVGDVEDDKGGSSVKFEPKLDDHTVVDLQFTRQLTLRTLELLFYERKWEKLVDLALKFTALTESRYVEQVFPIVILAQRQLADRIISAGEVVPQLHFIKAEQDYGKITPDVYATQLQLYMPEEIVDGQTKFVVHSADYRSEKDPMATALLKDNSLAKKLSSVPIDFDSSLAYYRAILDKCSYNAKALRHSRRLLVLYLGGQESSSLESSLESGDVGHLLDFAPHTAKPQPAVPEDLRTALFASIEDAQTVVLPKPQLNAVISSYEKTIEILLAHNQRSLAAQAMHELGNLQYHNSNLRAAYKWWCEAVDLIVNMADAVSNWRRLFEGVEDISAELLKRCGLWGCLLGSVITSNISQYILTSDLAMRSTCCFLSAYFFKSLFRASLPHPKADRDYASYDIGEGFEVTSLVPGIELLSDHFRADGRSVVAALRWVTEELARGKYNLFVLPLLTLYQYFTTYVCRDLQRAVDGRILKVRVLTDLGLFAEALTTLLRLLHGDRLPHIGDSNFRQVESKMPTIQFENSKPLYEPSNLKIVDLVINKRLSTNLSSLYGPHLTCQLSIAQAKLLIALADTISAIPFYNIKSQNLNSNDLVRQKTITTIVQEGANGPDLTMIPRLSGSPTKPAPNSKSQGGSQTGESPRQRSAVGSVALASDAEVEQGGEGRQMRVTKFTDETGIFSKENTKAVLLNTGEKIVSALHDILAESAEQEGGLHKLKPAELEMVTQCKLLLGDVARQRHHAGIAIEGIFAAMKILKSVEIFADKKKSRLEQTRHSSMKGTRHSIKQEVKVTDEQNNQFAYQNFQSRARLDARLWLECRIALVKNLMRKVSGMGLIKGKITKVVVEIKDCREYIREGLYESKICGDSAMMAEFQMQNILLNLLEGVSLIETIPLLQELLDTLEGIPLMSINDLFLHSQALVLLSDLIAVNSQDANQQLEMLENPAHYLLAHKSVLKQLELLGDQIQHYHPASDKFSEILSAPVSPMVNLYLPQVSFLAQVKLRLGHVLSQRAAKDASMSGDAKVSTFTNALGVLTTALHMNSICINKQQHIESEIYLALGRIQRQLYLLEKFDYKDAADTLLSAIKSSHSHDHDLGLIRQAYMEIALIYLHSSENAHGVVPPSQSMDQLTSETATYDRDDTISAFDDTSSLASGLTAQSSTRSAVVKPKRKEKLSPNKERSRRKQKEVIVSEPEREKFAAFVAIKCAAQTASCQLSLAKINGDLSATKSSPAQDSWIDVPQFMALDLLGDYVIGEQRHVYKDWVEEQMAPLVESMEPKKVRTYDDILCDAQEETVDLNWIHYLGYQNILRRASSHSSLTVLHTNNSMSTDQSADQSVRYTLFSGFYTQRTAANHMFFHEYLPFYKTNCVAPAPPKALAPNLTKLSDSQQFRPPLVRVISTDYAANSATLAATSSAELTSDTQQLAPVPDFGRATSESLINTGTETVAVLPSENEVTLQWYSPIFSGNDTAHAEGLVYLLFALVKKDSSDKKVMRSYAGLCKIPKHQLFELHDSLIDVLQKAEMALVDSGAGAPHMMRRAPSVVTASAGTSTGGKGLKSKSAAKLKAVSPKLKKDEAIEGMMRQCMNEIYKLFGLEWPSLQPEVEAGEVETFASGNTATVVENKPSTPKLDQARTEKDKLDKTPSDLTTELVKIPFDITHGNIKSLERIFNPLYGHTLTHSKLLTWLVKAVPYSRMG